MSSLVKYQSRFSVSTGSGYSVSIASLIWSAVRGASPPKIEIENKKAVYALLLKFVGKTTVNGMIKSLLKIMALLICYHLKSEQMNKKLLTITKGNENVNKKKLLLQ